MILGLCILAFILFLISGWVPVPEPASWRHKLICLGLASLALVGILLHWPGGR